MTETVIETIQRDSVISFPLLGLELNPPASFSVFGFPIYFYGVLIVCGFLLAMLYCTRRAPIFGIKPDDFFPDMILWLLPLVIVGARIYYILFRLDDYLAHPASMLAIRDGGLAIYGGVIAGALVVFFFCRRRKISVPAMLDLVVYGLLIGQIIGRWGNFMNREAFGAETDIFCRMGLTPPGGTTVYVHPTFLYESLWNLIGLIFLIVWERRGKRKYDGQCALIYFFWYGLGRAWIEGLRTDSLYIGNTGLRVSQLLSLVLCVGALTVLIVQSRRRHDPRDLFVNRNLNKTETEAEETGR
ncbi:MAG: prolipoprotein diacylglyceryl transferase [Oscillospiraceae bacterium]|nr:prolipoprotein diacylglyceryl transferase [Oscillospiraceae bacterium]